jgi:hypothetical protein
LSFVHICHAATVLFPLPPLADRLHLHITTTIASATIKSSIHINFAINFHPHALVLVLVEVTQS